MRRKLLAMILMILLVVPFTGAVSGAEGAQEKHHIRYVYVTACESCAKVKQLLNELPDTLPLQEGSAQEAEVEIESLELLSNLALIEQLFETYQVPEADRVAPIVFLTDRYIAGGDAILEGLPTALAAGDALINGDPAGEAGDGTEEAGTASTAFTWMGVLGAGIVAGLNPCALSMLLFLFSILLSMNVKIGRVLATFLSSKFISYLLLGTLLLNLFRAWNPSWLGLVTRILLTVIAAVLIVMNLSDVVQSYREKYGKIKNQLPVRTRRFLHKRIERALSGNPRFLLLIVFALGVLVAFSEFLCAGQVYLATLLAGLQSGVETPRMFLYLVGFCLAFLLPSAVVGIALVRGQSMFAVSEHLRVRMPLIKLSTAIVMIAIVVVAWVIK